MRPNRVCLVGDLFTKGPDPGGVWEQVRDGGWAVTLGNHDHRLIEWLDGARPGDQVAAETARALDACDPTWRDALRGWPLFHEVAGWTVVHAGVHPTGDLALTDRRMALTMRRWPLDLPRFAPWHEQYTGTRRVIFGHDARRGLVRVERDGAPLLVGLDTGCVYGGRLSGYVIEADEVVSETARRVYQAVD